MTTAEVFRTPDERFANLPSYDFALNYVDVDGLRMHYLDEGPATASPSSASTARTWAYLYRKMIDPFIGGRAPGDRPRLRGLRAARTNRPTGGGTAMTGTSSW